MSEFKKNEGKDFVESFNGHVEMINYLKDKRSANEIISFFNSVGYYREINQIENVLNNPKKLHEKIEQLSKEFSLNPVFADLVRKINDA